jgi:hypothetical protein
MHYKCQYMLGATSKEILGVYAIFQKVTTFFFVNKLLDTYASVMNSYQPFLLPLFPSCLF